jgi:BirA family biotin operon repressor/biotin-[acetyl-CoA-carboxylase] ligase
MKRVKEYYTLLQADTSNNAADIITERYVRSLFRRNGFPRYADADGEFLACLLRVERTDDLFLRIRLEKNADIYLKKYSICSDTQSLLLSPK